MRIGITGAGGFLGGALTSALRADGHRVIRFVRQGQPGPDLSVWAPGEFIDQLVVDSLDAIVHLAGAGIGDRRWTAAYRREILASRVTGTRTVAEAIAASPHPPALLSGSAVGFYGTDPSAEFDETSAQGDGFLARVCAAWEQEAMAVAERTRVVLLRTGVALDPAGGSLARQLPLARFMLAGRLGSGKQPISWISRRDWVAAVRFLLGSQTLGPVNLTAPGAVTEAEFARALAHAVHRPVGPPIPGPALRLVLGRFADEGVLAGQRVRPRVLEELGFEFSDPELSTTLVELLESR